jgi:membrane protease YdiL (CAAX protease family)
MPDALICFVVGFLTANVAVVVATAFGADIDSIAVTVAGLVGLWAGLLISMTWVCRSKGSGSFAVDFGMRFERARDLIGIAYGLGTQIVIVPLLYLPLTWIVDDLADRLEAPARDLTNQAGGDTGVFVLAVLVIVGAPLVEELFYRGLLLRTVQARFGDRIAIGASALLFGLAHFQVIQFPALVLFGVVLGVLAVRYGRLGPGIFAHAAFNAVTMAVLIAQR